MNVIGFSIIFFILLGSSCGRKSAKAYPPSNRQSAATCAAYDTFEQSLKPALDRYCGDCHSKDRNMGGFDASYSSDSKSLSDLTRWTHVKTLITSNQMPPAGATFGSCEISYLNAFIDELKASPASAPADGTPCSPPNSSSLSYVRDVIPSISSCIACHGPDSGRVRLDVPEKTLAAEYAKWSRAQQLITLGLMPPKGTPALDRCALELVQTYTDQLSNELNTSDSSCGTETPIETKEMRRLTLTEYMNTILQSDISPGAARLDLALRAYPAPQNQPSFERLENRLLPEQLESFAAVAETISEDLKTNPQTLLKLSSCSIESIIQTPCYHNFLSNLSIQLFRRPLDDETRALLFNEIILTETDPDKIINQTLAYFLLSPRFLYHIETYGNAKEGQAEILELDDYSIASRISYGLTNSPPSGKLLEFAHAGKLRNPELRKALIAEILDTDAAKAILTEFFSDLLQIPSRVELHQKATFAGTIDLQSLPMAAQKEINDFVRYIIWDLKGSLKDLFISRHAITESDDLQKIYGLTPIAGTNRYVLPAEERRGLLTRAAFLLHDGYQSQPIERGVKILKNLFCQSLSRPDELKLNSSFRLEETLETTRAMWTKLTADPSCQSCHSSINPIGFSFEVFDNLGRFRVVEDFYNANGLHLGSLPIEAHAEVVLDRNRGVAVKSAVELADAMAESQEIKQCILQQWYSNTWQKDLNQSRTCMTNTDREGRRKENQSILDAFSDLYLRDAITKKRLEGRHE